MKRVGSATPFGGKILSHAGILDIESGTKLHNKCEEIWVCEESLSAAKVIKIEEKENWYI